MTLLAAVVFVAIGSIRLGAQGAYYDELHQATASFCWLGEPVELFARGKVLGLPLFNMTYSGAIKSHLYGSWMWATGSGYSLESWRWLGLLLGGAGILLFGALCGAALSWRRLAVLLAFVVTDATLIVGCRHDWGPIALAFLLRMTMLALSLRPARPGERAMPLVFGLLLGLSVYEKLSALVTVAPILLLFFADGERRRPRTWLAVLAGSLVGAAPVILWNLQWLSGPGKVASLGQTGTPAAHGFDELLALLRECAVMPQGDQVCRFIFGPSTAGWMQALEAALLSAALVVGLRAGRPRVRALAIGAALTLLGLFALPSRTGVHHWVLVTPWQYLAVTFALTNASTGWLLRWLVAVWLVLRVVTLSMLVAILGSGAATARWSPDLHRLQAFAATCGAGDLFVAGDWGVATQVACAAQGRAGIVVECSGDAGLPDLARAERVFLLALQPPSGVRPGVFDRLRGRLEALPGWRPAAPPEALRGLRDLQVLPFRRVE